VDDRGDMYFYDLRLDYSLRTTYSSFDHLFYRTCTGWNVDALMRKDMPDSIFDQGFTLLDFVLVRLLRDASTVPPRPAFRLRFSQRRGCATNSHKKTNSPSVSTGGPAYGGWRIGYRRGCGWVCMCSGADLAESCRWPITCP
jgi:hypothetical protein